MALGFMRRHRDWLKYMLLLVVLAFIILYIPAFQDAGMGDGGQIVARVGDENITVNEFQRMWMVQRQRMTAGGMDPAMMEQMGMRDQVLQALIDRELVVQEARRLGLTVDDDAVASEIARSPAFQSRGSFMGAEELRRQLALQGRSEEEFTESVREDLMVERLQSLVTDGVRVSDQEAEHEFRRRNERVKLEYVFIDAGPFRAQSTATDPEVEARFQAQREGYRISERRVLGYILLDPTAMQDQAKATDADIEAFYRDNDRQFQQPEEACARHILVKVKATPAAPGHTEEEARALAQKALDQVRGGADFAEVAKKSSEDARHRFAGRRPGLFRPRQHGPRVRPGRLLHAAGPGLGAGEDAAARLPRHPAHVPPRADDAPPGRGEGGDPAAALRAQGARAGRTEGRPDRAGPEGRRLPRAGRQGADVGRAEERARGP